MQQIPVDVGRNFLSGLTGGMQVGQAMRQSQDNNQLRNIFATQDINDPAVQQRIMGLDPQTGMQLQNQTFQRQQQAEALRYNRGRDAQADARAQKTFEMQIEEQARAQSAAENQAAADVILQNLTPAVVAHRQGPEQFEAWKAGNVQVLQQAGIDPATLTYDVFPSAAAKLKGAADMFADAARIVPDAPQPADEYARYAQEEMAEGRTPLSRLDYKRAAQKTTQTRVGPDGSVEIVEGFGGGGLPKTTEGEKSASGYLSRMRAAESTLDSLETEMDAPAVRSLTSLIVGGTNFEGLALSDEQSKILQAQRDWVRAKLRKESGAVIGADEMAEEVRTYFPLPGEGSDIAEQKRRSRKQAERQFEIMAGNAADQATSANPAQQGVNPFAGMSDADFSGIDINSLTPEQVDQLFEARQ